MTNSKNTEKGPNRFTWMIQHNDFLDQCQVISPGFYVMKLPMQIKAAMEERGITTYSGRTLLIFHWVLEVS